MYAYGLTFDDYTKNDPDHEVKFWTQICNECAEKIEDMAYASITEMPAVKIICGVKGCKNDAEYYLNFNNESEKKMIYQTTIEIPIEINYDYQPAEPCVKNLDSPMCGPGCPEEVTINAIETHFDKIKPIEIDVSGDICSELEEEILNHLAEMRD